MPQVSWIGHPRLVLGVVVHLVSTQVPTPRKLVGSNQTLISDVMDWSFSCNNKEFEGSGLFQKLIGTNLC